VIQLKYTILGVGCQGENARSRVEADMRGTKRGITLDMYSVDPRRYPLISAFINMSKLLYEEESYKIRGACFTVWKEFGSAFKETVVERALSREFREKGLLIDRQKHIDIYYKNEKMGTYIPDFIIDNKVIVEIKVKPILIQQDRKQFWYYLRGSSYKLGFLVNFGTKNLEIVRRVYDSARIGVNARY